MCIRRIFLFALLGIMFLPFAATAEPSPAAVLPGTLCGAYVAGEVGGMNGIQIPCNGVQLSSGCPAGYLKLPITGGTAFETYTLNHKRETVYRFVVSCVKQ
ncbi:MAG: hypothetical protein PHY92_03815 [Alphaproteobacteria bacterium]|nr:hypothetical protein [Alphaproteobacteria bacterium]